MGDAEKGFSEKERISAEIVRDGPALPTIPVMPTVNPEIEKRETPASQLHPAFYVMYVFHNGSEEDMRPHTYLHTLHFRY